MILALLRHILARRSHRGSATATTPVAAAAPTRLTPDRQWQRIADAVQSSVDTATRARWLHDSAALQIDSTTYAFGSLLEELAAVMPVPVEGWGRRATVHDLDSYRRRYAAGSLAA